MHLRRGLGALVYCVDRQSPPMLPLAPQIPFFTSNTKEKWNYFFILCKAALPALCAGVLFSAGFVSRVL